MVSTNCNPAIAIVYSSVTGNTAELAGMVVKCVKEQGMKVHVYSPEEFCRIRVDAFDAVLVGSYTWGSGEIPHEMQRVYRHFESADCKHVVTAVFGTGDSFFAEFCGAVDRFRDMLYVHATLAATLKVELLPQERDSARCEKFAAAVMGRLAVSKMEKRKATWR